MLLADDPKVVALPADNPPPLAVTANCAMYEVVPLLLIEVTVAPPKPAVLIAIPERGDEGVMDGFALIATGKFMLTIALVEE